MRPTVLFVLAFLTGMVWLLAIYGFVKIVEAVTA